MRVLVTSTSGSGHVHPLLPVAVALREVGHEVRWALSQPGRSTVEGAAFTTFAAGLAVADRQEAFETRFGADVAALAPDARRSAAFSGHFGYLAAPAMVADLQRVVEAWAPDLIVHEPAELAGPMFATALGIPHVTVAFSGALPPAALDAAANAVAPLWERLGVPVPSDLSLFRYAYFHPFAPSMGQRPDAATVLDLRPGTEDGAIGKSPARLADVGTRRPLIYVTFGTEMGPIAPWSVLLPVLSGLAETDVVVTIGGALNPDSLGPLPAHVRVERYVPQALLLPRCRLVVSHGGAGTMLAAAVHGVPQLLMPLGADQFENTRALVQSGAGHSGIGLRSDELAEEIEALLEDGRHRTAASDLAAELASMPGTDRVVAVVESLVT